MAIEWADVVDMAPQLNVVLPGAQRAILLLVNNRINIDDLAPEDADMAARYLAAHFGELWRRKGQSGIVQSERIAATDIQLTYMAKVLNDPLEATSYGEQYLTIIAGSIARVGFVL
jgi:hypothetical protein